MSFQAAGVGWGHRKKSARVVAVRSKKLWVMGVLLLRGMAEALASAVAGGTAVLTDGTAELEDGVAVAPASSAAVQAGASPVATVLATDCRESAGASAKTELFVYVHGAARRVSGRQCEH